MIALAEDNGNATWATIGNIRNDGFGVSLIRIMLALCFDCGIFTLVAWYISAVFPGMQFLCYKWQKKSFFMLLFWQNIIFLGNLRNFRKVWNCSSLELFFKENLLGWPTNGHNNEFFATSRLEC